MPEYRGSLPPLAARRDESHDWELRSRDWDTIDEKWIEWKNPYFYCDKCGHRVWPAAPNYSSRTGEMRKMGISEDCPFEMMKTIMQE